MTVSRPQSALSNHSDDQRLHFHRQLMGRANSSTATNQLELHQPLLPNRQSTLGLNNAASCSFIDPLRNSTTDLSPYHPAIFNHPSSTRPSSRSSTLSSISPHPAHALGFFPPPLPSPHSSLSSRHSSSIRGDVYNAATLLPPNTASTGQFFDPDYEAERLRLAKLEQRRSLASIRPNTQGARNSSEGSIRSVHSFRSVGPSRSKALKPPGTNVGSVYRPSPLRSASTPALATLEAEAEKKKQRKEMKEEYQKMRAARIEEEKRLTQEAAEKYPSQDKPGWFATRFKKNKELPSTTRIAGHGIDDRRSTSQSSATESSTPSSSPLDDGSHSTVPTSVEDDYQEFGQRPGTDEEERLTRPSPTHTHQDSSARRTPKTIGRTIPARINIIKLNRIFDSFKSGTNTNQTLNDPTPIHTTQKGERRNKHKVSVVESRSPLPGHNPHQIISSNNNNPLENHSGQVGWWFD
ncbi:hypothetical protein PSHT_06131 [Puccinia striiformis]|uniref:Uncharacterized protein n=1 Tax=Puccinia striiformis TaxID=27350 RepID=A0A2S4W8S0_9BASI|nr:hypothetical protein PSHT_06131 [Puccinia striiformis]